MNETMYIALTRKEYDSYQDTLGITLDKVGEANDGSVVVKVNITGNMFELNRYNKPLILKVCRIMDDEYDKKIILVLKKREWKNVGKS